MPYSELSLHGGLALNTDLLHQRIPNLTRAARSVGLRAATLLDLVNGKTKIEHAEIGTLVLVAEIAHCTLDELVIASPRQEESFAATVTRWSESTTGVRHDLGAPHVADPLSEAERLATIAALPAATVVNAGSPAPRGPYAI